MTKGIDTKDRALIAICGTPKETYAVVSALPCPIKDARTGVMIQVMRDCTIIDVVGREFVDMLFELYKKRHFNKSGFNTHALFIKTTTDGDRLLINTTPLYEHFTVYGENAEDTEIDYCGNGFSFSPYSEYETVVSLFTD